MRKIALAVLVASAAALSAVAVSAEDRHPPGLESVPFEVLYESPFAAWHAGKADLVIDRQSSFASIWKKASQGSAFQPAVDFADSQVLAFFLGAKPSSGFSVEVAAVESDGQRLHVWVLDVEPAPDNPVHPVWSSPVQVVKIPRLGLPIVFHHLKMVQVICG